MQLKVFNTQISEVMSNSLIKVIENSSNNKWNGVTLYHGGYALTVYTLQSEKKKVCSKVILNVQNNSNIFIN